ncbi:MAG TPA: NAD(P)-dependent oxidoreductase [Candidatus Xenobia bacterium]|nr:NAD(P)-dependent oxidoreductase [Candidatus Xenobia bacterium]
MRETAPKLTPEQYERNFADIAPPLTRQQALLEGARCLFCYDAPCIQACPTRIDVPSFIKKILTGNLKGSARVILSANILGQSCGRVCPTEVLCEGACVLNREGEKPVEIGRLQRYAVDYVLENNIRVLHAGARNGKRVACIGSGPASLGCASELAQRGYEVVIYDKNELPGGLNTYGIAAYKTRAHESVREVKLVEDLGVKIHQRVEVGRDISLSELEAKFDAIFIGIGLGETWALDLPGEDLRGAFGAMDFIERTKKEPFHKVDVGKRVAVIGAGNTAVDVATAARRLGAEWVAMIYRRGEREMPAFKYERELAQKDGVTFMWNTQPVRIVGNGVVEGLECVRTRLHGDGRRARVEPIPGTEFTLPVEMVVRALGQQPVLELLRSVSGILIKDDCVVVDPDTGQTGNPKYFAGGDCVNGGKEVVDAVAEGMKAARGIDAYLRRAS